MVGSAANSSGVEGLPGPRRAQIWWKGGWIRLPSHRGNACPGAARRRSQPRRWLNSAC